MAAIGGPADRGRSVTDPPGRLLASGRAAEVYDLGDGTVLRRYRSPSADTAQEARVMRYVAEHGYPAPKVLAADGPDLVMPYVEGPTMFDVLRRRPATLFTHARRLSKLQQQLAAIAAPDWLMAPGWTPDPAGDAVLHLDLHPMNVVLSPDGPVVIDWTNAAAGPPGFDASITYVVMASYTPDDQRERIAAKVFAETFRRLRGRREIDAFLAAACDHRLADPNLTPEEREGVAAMRTKSRSRR